MMNVVVHTLSCGCKQEGCLGVWRTTECCTKHIEKAFDTMAEAKIRKFDTGATRDTDEGKLKYEGFISPLVEKRFAEYMHLHRKQANGELRAPDNWKNGIPLAAYSDSLIRHVYDFWLHREGFPNEATEQDIEAVLCAIRFNVDGFLYEILKQKAGK